MPRPRQCAWSQSLLHLISPHPPNATPHLYHYLANCQTDDIPFIT
ncbi:hypothetical protein AZE42_13143 [Rhizopogon vesiculosus]|uniref:Uncharacterized protein n=1 Tax=Rhizopogon vesiculosus TaxID=180088 RepID=A0A1J8QQM4_9AGAM|nr:hypothetical protein AZE42_13143 [Rhizopogon vesiculosus]